MTALETRPSYDEAYRQPTAADAMTNKYAYPTIDPTDERKFSIRVARNTNKRTGKAWFSVAAWKYFHVTMGGVSADGYTLTTVASTNILKSGNLGTFDANACEYSTELYRAHKAWVEAGKPDEFIWLG